MRVMTGVQAITTWMLKSECGQGQRGLLWPIMVKMPLEMSALSPVHHRIKVTETFRTQGCDGANSKGLEHTDTY
ncbi:hypothetical protein XELAEV_18013005mg [Xenopus laevis]|uniref:Uncharacterized protein n=1 Tax=Xenopus laevis TaxID=8355 RepID=A0A974DQW3_XENLA|nr:hypothetical protein XELAEV_18013005mg [Xenopus laevis]